MKRQIAAWTIAVVAVLGIAGCSGTPSADSDSSTSSESSSPAEQNTDQSVADACASVGSQISGVATELSSLDMSAAMSDPEGTVATFTETVDAIGEPSDPGRRENHLSPFVSEGEFRSRDEAVGVVDPEPAVLPRPGLERHPPAESL